MFITLLAVTFAIAAVVTFFVELAFRRSIGGLLAVTFPPEIVAAWRKYVCYVVYVVGISGGVRVWQLERYIEPKTPITLNVDRWVLEVYHTIVGAMQSTAWLLFVFFVVAMIAYGISRANINRKAATA